MSFKLLSFFLLGALFSAFILWLYHRLRHGSYKKMLEGMLQSAEHEMERKRHKLDLELQQKTHESQIKCDQLLQQAVQKAESTERKIDQKQTLLKEAQKESEKLSQKLFQKNLALQKQQQELSQKQQQVLDEKNRLLKSLEKTSELTQKEAEEKLFERLTLQVKKDCAVWSFRFLKEKKALAEKQAAKLISDTLNRLSGSCASQTALSTLALPFEEMKSRIIGREGRNIQYIENIMGVNLLVDETPNTLLISCYDPLRKAIASEALKNLIHDGRIHPSRIDEEYAKAKQVIEDKIHLEVEKKCHLLEIDNLHPKLLNRLAQMHLMDSLGQNLLEHSYQVALIMSMMASELQLDAALAKRIGFLHDIGKTCSAQSQGSHAILGYKLAKQHGESDLVANGIGCHHNEMSPKTIEASLCETADTLSAARPGARSESMHYYFKRIKKLEKIACSFPEVDRAYAIQSGKEIRVITQPNKVDDASLMSFAQTIAHKIEKELQYAGKIKVSVLRTHEAIEYTR